MRSIKGRSQNNIEMFAEKRNGAGLMSVSTRAGARCEILCSPYQIVEILPPPQSQ
jgi:hypothetical protein